MSFEDWMIEDGFTDPEDYLLHLQAEAMEEDYSEDFVPFEPDEYYEELNGEDFGSEDPFFVEANANFFIDNNTGDNEPVELSEEVPGVILDYDKWNLAKEKNENPGGVEDILKKISSEENISRQQLLEEVRQNNNSCLITLLAKALSDKDLFRKNIETDSITIVPYGPKEHLYVVWNQCSAFLGRLLRIYMTEEYKISLFEGYGLITLLLENVKNTEDKQLIRWMDK